MDRTASAEAGEVVFLFGGLAIKRGGVTRAVLARMRMFAQAGFAVRLLLTGNVAQENSVERSIRELWELPDAVEFRYFWREAAPGGGGAPVDPAAEQGPGLGCAVERQADGGQVVSCFADGVLVTSKHYDLRGDLVRVDHVDNALRPVSRERYDERGRLVRVDELEPDSGEVRLRRWFDASGECWLTTWLTPRGTATRAVRHKPSPVAYGHVGECVAEWVDTVLRDSPAPLVFADSRYQDHVLRALKHPRARTVSVLHNCHTSRPHRSGDATKGNYRPSLENLRAVDAVVALTRAQRDDISKRYGGGNFVVINHPTPPAPEVSVPRTPGLLVAVTRLDEQKRLDHAVRAFAIAARKVPEARFDIYGKGSQSGALRQLVRDLGIPDLVRFKGYTGTPLKVFAGATATVLSSWFEGFPLVLTEAMGVGTPFVCYDVNYGPAEVIRDGVDGLLVPSGDIDALADAMVRLLGDPDYAARLGARASEVGERFSTERWRREWLDLHATVQRQRR